jgi:hypothetical protein
VFPNTPRHRSEFSFKILVHGGVLADDCQFLYQQDERFNAFDEECLRKPASHSASGYYKFLDTRDIDRVIGDGTLGTIVVSNVTYFRTLETDTWGTIADPLEAALALTFGDNFILTENSPELEITNNAGIGQGAFKKFAVVESGGRIDMSGATFIHTTPELFIYSTAVGDLDKLTLDMCVNAERRYDACLRIRDLGALRERIFKAGRIRDLDCKVSDLFEPGLIHPVEYEGRTRDIREGPVIDPSPFKKDVRFKSQS